DAPRGGAQLRRRRGRAGPLQRARPAGDAGDGLDGRLLRVLVHRQARPQHDAVAGLHVQVPRADSQRRPLALRAAPGAGARGGLRVRTVFITGAARGIGAATAERLHARGDNVALVGLEPERLEALAARLGDRAAFFEADVTDRAALDAAVAGAVERFGGIDVAIANAGIHTTGSLLGADP